MTDITLTHLPKKLLSRLPSVVDARKFDVFIVPKGQEEFDYSRLELAVQDDERYGPFDSVDALMQSLNK